MRLDESKRGHDFDGLGNELLGIRNDHFDCVENARSNFIYRLQPHGPGRFGSLEFAFWMIIFWFGVWILDLQISGLEFWILEQNLWPYASSNSTTGHTTRAGLCAAF